MSAFHPLEKSALLTLGAEELAISRPTEQPTRSLYVSERLFHAVLLCYLKHHKMQDCIGWDKLGDVLHNAICEAAGDDAYCRWLEVLEEKSP